MSDNFLGDCLEWKAKARNRPPSQLLRGWRSEEIGHQCGSLASIRGIRLTELGTHPPLLYAEFCPIREEDENDNDEPAYLGDGDRHAEKSGEDAGVNGVTHHSIGT